MLFYAGVAGISIAVGVPACVVSIMQGISSGKAFLSIARQPETSRIIRNLLMICLAFMETLAIYGLLVSFLLVNKVF